MPTGEAKPGVRRKDPTMKIVGQRMQIARGPLDHSEAGERVGISGARWGAYERAERTIPLAILRKLPAAFYRPLNFFLGLPDERGLSDEEARIVSLLRAIEDPVIKEAAIEGAIRSLESQIQLDRSLREREREPRSASR